MSDLEELLADTADFLQARLREDRVLRGQLRQALAQGARPHLERSLGPELPGDCVRIVVEQMP